MQEEIEQRHLWGENMTARDELERIFLKNGLDFKWIDPKKIVVSNWVRMKCMYGCPDYGRVASCPPNTPSIPECQKFFQEYNDAVVFHFEKRVAKPEDRHAWTREVNSSLLKIEREVFLSGHRKAFLLFMDSCELCEKCTGKRETCKQPKLSRPTPEALGVDVYATVAQIGYPIQVLKDYSEKMNRYAFLMIE
jgi:predicted metal-binding protein